MTSSTYEERKLVADALRNSRLIKGSYEAKLRASIGVDLDTPGCEVLGRLADLIDPRVPFTMTRNAVEVDRRELLRLADCIEDMEKYPYKDKSRMLVAISFEGLKFMADQIRHACGVKAEPSGRVAS